MIDKIRDGENSRELKKRRIRGFLESQRKRFRGFDYARALRSQSLIYPLFFLRATHCASKNE